MYPQQVEINEENVRKLTQTLETAYKSIVSEINTATDFGVANRKAILSQIEGILKDLGVDIQKFLEDELPGYYETGADEAVKQLTNIGADVNVSEGFNRVHREAIAALVDDTSRSFGESLTGVARSSQLLLGKISRETITQKLAEGVIGGKARKEVIKIIKGTLQEQGLDALVDKSGRSWTLDRYSDMLFRTKAVEARNRGLINRIVENGYDLVQVSSHGADDVCGKWEGKILSSTGSTPGYPTVAQAENDGLFHPNCRHAINVLIPSLARQTSGYDNSVPTKIIGDKGNKQSSKKISFGTGKEAVTIDNLYQYESDLIDLHDLEIVSKTVRGAFGSYKNYGGTIRPALLMNTKMMKGVFPNQELYEKQIEYTFYHELGHFIDARIRPGVTSETKSGGPEAPMRSDVSEIVYNRLKRGYLYEDSSWVRVWGMTEQNVKDVSLGRSVQLTSTSGQTRSYSLPRSRLKYYYLKEEIFADAYSQFRVDVDEFKKYAPEMHKYFVELGGGNL